MLKVRSATAVNPAEFSTMIPHAFGAHEGPVEILCIFDPAGEQAHRCPSPGQA